MIPDYVGCAVAAGHGPRAHPPWAPSPRGRGAREIDHSAIAQAGALPVEDPSPALRAPSPRGRGARGRIATSEDSDERQRELTPTT